MQQTEKYQFNLIEGGDDFSPNPLNENMEKVEAQFETVTSTLAEHAAELGVGGQNCRIAYGTYKGTGTYGSDNPNSLTFDFCPVMVVFGSYDLTNTMPWPTVAIRGVNASHSESDSARLYVTWKTNGISWYSSQGQTYQNNYNGRTYAYVVLGYSA